MKVDLVLSNSKAYVNNRIEECSIAIDQGRIFKIGREANMPEAEANMDLSDMLVLPGFIDIHVHLRDQGKTREEDFYTGTAAAAAGGVTTVLDMPNNKPVTMNVGSLKRRMKVAERKILVDVGFYSEFPENIIETSEIVNEGALAFKLYMAEQIGGVDVDDDQALLEAFKIPSRLKVPVAVHAEDRLTLKKAEDEFRRSNRNDIEAFLKAHSENVEVKAVRRLLKIAEQAGVHLHICHVSTGDALKLIVDAKKAGLPLTCETTPHHLFLSVDDLRRIGPMALTVPPIREKQHPEALWNGIKEGYIDILASDHAPHTYKEKKADSVWNVKVGIPGLETTLPLLLTEVKRGRLSIGDIVRLLSEKPAGFLGLERRGCLERGNNADLVVVDLDRKYKIDASKFHSKAKYSPFDGWCVEGKPVKTIVGGQLVMDEGEIVADPGTGKIVRRE